MDVGSLYQIFKKEIKIYLATLQSDQILVLTGDETSNSFLREDLKLDQRKPRL
jgi:hypothetical protein